MVICMQYQVFICKLSFLLVTVFFLWLLFHILIVSLFHRFIVLFFQLVQWILLNSLTEEVFKACTTPLIQTAWHKPVSGIVETNLELHFGFRKWRNLCFTSQVEKILATNIKWRKFVPRISSEEILATNLKWRKFMLQKLSEEDSCYESHMKKHMPWRSICWLTM